MRALLNTSAKQLLWRDLRSPPNLAPTCARLDLRCRRLKLAPDGRWVASAANDGKAILWDLTTGRSVRTLAFRSGVHPTHFEFSPHEFLLAVAALQPLLRMRQRTAQLCRLLFYRLRARSG